MEYLNRARNINLPQSKNQNTGVIQTWKRSCYLWLKVLASLFFTLPALAFAGNSTTKYPIVMVGGAFAFDKIDSGFISVDYWYGIIDSMTRDGADVLVTNISGAQTNEKRCEELVLDITDILEETRPDAGKVNIFAHSQGTLAARCAADILGNKIASITSINGMNRGTHVSPWLRSLMTDLGVHPNSRIESFLNLMVSFLFDWAESGSFASIVGDFNSPERTDQSLLILESSTAPASIAAFNQRYSDGLPDQNCMNNSQGMQGDVDVSDNHLVNGIRYYSIGGKANSSLTSFGELFDPLYYLLVTTQNSYLVKPNNSNFKWDGLVPQCGQKLGEFIGWWKMNHFDAIGQSFGLTPSYVKSLYRGHANRLKNAQL